MTAPIFVDFLNLKVTLIEAFSRGNAPQPSRCHSATGFFYRQNDDKYLITNRHVVVAENEEKYPDFIRIKVHTNRTTLLSTRVIEIPLYADTNRRWIEHPDNLNIDNPKEKIDLAVIKINDNVQTTDAIEFFSEVDIARADFILGVGDLCIVTGYPYAFHDTLHYLPIVRSGTLASTWGAFFRGKKCFLVDSKLHPGTSGSPVVKPVSSVRRDIRGGVGIGNFPPVLLGVNSGTYGELDLNTIWYSALIPEIINQPRPTTP